MIKFIPLLFVSFSLHAAPCKDLMAKMLEHYPDQNTQKILLRFENAKNKHMFMRAFIPYYYREAYEAREALPIYQKLKNHTGQIVGDAHVENFGFIVSNKGTPKFTFNDFDDVAEAPLFLDVMRLSQSASYLGDYDHVKLIEAYKKGLSGTQHKYTPYVEGLRKKAEKGGHASKADVLATKEGPRFAAKGEPNFPVTKSEQTEIDKLLKAKFGKNTVLHDSYRTMKESGGSAFGNRYHVLTEINGEMQFIELKEIMDGGVIASWTKKQVTNEKRVQNSMQSFLGNEFDERLAVVKVNKKPFQLRFKSEGNKSIDAAAMKAKELEQVIADEFYILGQLHRTSLGGSNTGVAAYARDLEKVTPEDWESSVKVMKKTLKQAYADSGK